MKYRQPPKCVPSGWAVEYGYEDHPDLVELWWEGAPDSYQEVPGVISPEPRKWYVVPPQDRYVSGHGMVDSEWAEFPTWKAAVMAIKLIYS
jgi:hypothetical protein